MVKKRMVLDLKKVQPTETEDGMLTRYGMRVAHAYARKWVGGFIQDFEMEERFPELESLFQDIRCDPELAWEHAIPFEE